MVYGTANSEHADLDDFIEAYEEIQTQTGEADLADFLPAVDHPLYRVVLLELVRVDLEYSWQFGRPQPLEFYRRRFPEQLSDPATLRELAFEEFRLRQQAGENVRPGEYQERFGVDTSEWPLAGTGTKGRQLLEQAGVASKPGQAEPLAEAAHSFREFLAKHGGDGDLDGWLAAFSGSYTHAQFLRELYHADPEAAERLTQAATAMPSVGARLFGFDLIAELGRGAFGRVYLARQADLAQRLVALKVATDLWGESQTLAQLQHTYIVPIYSVHRAGPFHAVCMPYFGAATLADVLKDLRARRALPDSGKELLSTLASRRRSTVIPDGESKPLAPPDLTPPPPAGLESPAVKAVSLSLLEKLSYVDAVLSLVARLADGLAHAHERGILHRDLKPANVLLTDDGEPMLLDFNLSEDTKLRNCLSAAVVGGTLPYMAPEHLEAFRNGVRRIDARADIYALGVMLYELLTGRQPYPIHSGVLVDVATKMIADRERPPPRLRCHNRDVSPAVEAIVRHCLEPDLTRRYQTARELAEDLDRQLNHQPLRHASEPSLRERGRKWLRRHPRLSVAAAVALLLGGVLLALTARLTLEELRASRLESANAVMNAAAARSQFHEDMQAVQVRLLGDASTDATRRAQAIEECTRLLARYRVVDDPAWQDLPGVRALSRDDRAKLREDVAELLLLWAQAVAGTKQPRDGESVRLALTLNRRAEEALASDSVPLAVRVQRANLLGQSGEIKQPRSPAPELPARDLAMLASDLILQGNVHEALPLLEEAARRQPQLFTVWFGLGMCNEILERYADAAACYGTCIALAPRLAPLYLRRGTAYLRQNQFKRAVADLDRAIELQPDLAEAYMQRGLARVNLKSPQPDAALRDLSLALEHGSPPCRVLLMRAQVREKLGDQAGAERDVAAGLQCAATDEVSWLARGSAQLRRGEARAALKEFEQALQHNPRSLAALQNKAHILAERLNRPEDALHVLDRAVAIHPDYALARAGRGVLLARQGKRTAALADAVAAVAMDPQPRITYQAAGIYALTSKEEADDRIKALELLGVALRQGFGLELIDRDPDLEPLRALPEFRRLAEAARGLRARTPSR